MSRRYLTLQEVETRLVLGKSVEIFLGGFDTGSAKCIRWASFTKEGQMVIGRMWESIDEGSIDYCDIYSFSPCHDDWEPVIVVNGNTIDSVVQKLSISLLNFVNYGAAQEEYADFKAS